ncbi:MAG: hypothetical protein AB1630_00545, partial [bacterium]
ATITYNTLPDGTYTLWGTLTDKAGNKGTSTAIGWVIVDTTEPIGTITDPTQENPKYTPATATVCITYSYTEANPQTATVMIGTNTSQPITSTTFSIIGSPTYQILYSTLTYTNVPDGSYTVWVVIQDLSDPTGTFTQPNSIIVDSTGPNVGIISPSGTQTWVSTATSLTVIFTYTDNNPASYTIGLGYGTTTFATWILGSGTLTQTEETITTTVNMPSNVYEATYTLYVVVIDKSLNYGTATPNPAPGTGTLYMDLTKPQALRPFGSQSTPGSVDPSDPATWDDFEAPIFGTTWQRGMMPIWGVAADTPGPFASCPDRVVVYYIYAGKTMPTGSPTNGYPFTSEADLMSKYSSDYIKCGESIVYPFASPYNYAGTWTMQWNNQNAKAAGGCWLISFVYDKAGNVLDPGGGGILSDTTPPQAITWLEASVDNQYNNVLLKWDSNGVPNDDIGVDRYRIYRHTANITWLNPVWLLRDGYPGAEERSPGPGKTETTFIYDPVYEVNGVWGSFTTIIAPDGKSTYYQGTGTNYFDATSYYYYETSTSQWKVVWTTPLPGTQTKVYLDYRNIRGSETAVYDKKPPEKQRFYYTVTAVDTSGNESPMGNVVWVDTPDITPPPDINDLSANVGSLSTVKLVWVETVTTDGITSALDRIKDNSYFKLYRKEKDSSLVLDEINEECFLAKVDFNLSDIIGFPPGTTTFSTCTYTGYYTDTTVEIGKSYAYGIFGYDASLLANRTSLTSSNVIIATDTTPPSAITDLVATANQGTLTITLTATAPTDKYFAQGSLTYNIYRGTISNFEVSASSRVGTNTGTGTTPFTWTDTTIGTEAQGTIYYYVVQAIDPCGNISDNSNVSNGCKVSDITAPTGTITINNNDTYTTSRNNVTLSIQVSDNLDTPNNIYMDLMEGTGTFAGNWEKYSSLRAFTLLSQTDGIATVSVRFKDSQGNIGGTTSDTIILDTTPPTGTIEITGTSDEPTKYTTINTVTLTLTANDTNGIDKIRFSNDNAESWSAWEDQTLTKTWTLSQGDGTKIVYYQIRDNAGNTYITSDSIILDTEGATGASIVINEGAVYTNTENVTLTLWADEIATSPIDEMWISNNSDFSTGNWETYTTTKAWTLDTPATDGIKTVYARFKDEAGNTSTAVSDTITLDKTEPQGTISINDNATYTLTTSVLLTITGTDSLSGVSQMEVVNGTTFSNNWEAIATTKAWLLTTGDGVKTVSVRFKDNAGNISGGFQDTITLDTTPPTGSIEITGTSDEPTKYTTINTVTLALTANDTNGIDKIRFSNDNAESWSAWEDQTLTKTWTLSQGDGT